MKITIPRTGNVPLELDGKEIATVEKKITRRGGWTIRITLYRIDPIGYATHVYFTSGLCFETCYDISFGPRDSLREILVESAGFNAGHCAIRSRNPEIDEIILDMNSTYLIAMAGLMNQLENRLKTFRRRYPEPQEILGDEIHEEEPASYSDWWEETRHWEEVDDLERILDGSSFAMHRRLDDTKEWRDTVKVLKEEKEWRDILKEELNDLPMGKVVRNYSLDKGSFL